MRTAAFIAAHPTWVIEGGFADLINEGARASTSSPSLNPGVDPCLANAGPRSFETQLATGPKSKRRCSRT